MIRTAAIITATEAEPRKYGKQIMLGGMLDHLCDRLGPENVHLVQIGRLDFRRPRVAYQRHIIAKPRARSQLRALLRHVVLARVGFGGDRISLQEAALRSPDIERALGTLIEDIDPDLEIWDTVRLGQYARSLPARPDIRRLLYADDLFSERYTALLCESEKRDLSGNPGGEFRKLLPGPLRELLGDPRVYLPLLKIERELVAEAEVRQPHWFDGTYLVGPAEAERLRARCPGPTIETLPPLLPEPHTHCRRPLKAPVFTFLGGFDYAPNLDGLGWFLEFCRDAVLSALPNVQIRVVGSGTERGLPQAAAWGDRIRFSGWVDDLDAELAPSVALLSPLRTGSGVKIKVLEAMARGLPVIATPAGVEGIDARTTSGCLVAETPETFARAMRTACDPRTNRWLSIAARRFWNRTYSPRVVRRQYDSIFGLVPVT
jgi:glycosyltransferase involved in cell wall biosynthesis